jgi:hypothetical protein
VFEFNKKRREEELERELLDHIELEAKEHEDNGLSPEEAHYAARRAFGNMALMKEDVRQAWGWTFASQLWQDARYALRTLGRDRAFSAAAIVSLVLGIGANTAIFSLMDALLLRFLPVPNPGELVEIMLLEQGQPGNSFGYPPIVALAAKKDIFRGVAGFSGYSFNVTSNEGPVRVSGLALPVSFTKLSGLNLWPAACSRRRTTASARHPQLSSRMPTGRAATPGIST